MLTKVFFFVIDQKVLLPVFLPENQFSASGTGSRVETGSEPAPERPRWKTGDHNRLGVGNRKRDRPLPHMMLLKVSWGGGCSHTWSTHFAALAMVLILGERVALGLSGGQHLLGGTESVVTYAWIKSHLKPQFGVKGCFSLCMTVSSLPHTADCLRGVTESPKRSTHWGSLTHSSQVRLAVFFLLLIPLFAYEGFS